LPKKESPDSIYFWRSLRQNNLSYEIGFRIEYCGIFVQKGNDEVGMWANSFVLVLFTLAQCTIHYTALANHFLVASAVSYPSNMCYAALWNSGGNVAQLYPLNHNALTPVCTGTLPCPFSALLGPLNFALVFAVFWAVTCAPNLTLSFQKVAQLHAMCTDPGTTLY
jgi:hypothetical protein